MKSSEWTPTIIVQVFVTVAVTLAVIVPAVLQQPIAKILESGWMILLGWYFRSVVQVEAQRLAENILQVRAQK